MPFSPLPDLPNFLIPMTENVDMGDMNSGLQEAKKELDVAISFSNDTSSEDIFRSYEATVYRPLDKAIGVVALYVTETGAALEGAEGAMYALRGLSSLGSLSFVQIKDASTRVHSAEQQFASATKLVEMVLENTEAASTLLESVPVALGEYANSSKYALDSAQQQEESIRGVRTSMAAALDGQAEHPLTQSITQLAKGASILSERYQGADQYVDREADPDQLQAFLDSLRKSRAFLENALDRPLDQFVDLLTDATNEVGEADLRYLENLRDRLRQGIDAHVAVSEFGGGVKRLLLKLRNDIN